MSERTPTPWTVDGVGIGAKVRGADMTLVALRHRLPGAVHEANAEFIVRACNAHDELLAALRYVLSENPHYCASPLVHAAICKAEGR